MAELIVKLGDQEIQRVPVTKPVLTIGRASDNDVIIENLSISRKHAELRIHNNAFVISDLNSSNGTRVNGLPITESEIEDGDIIGIGKHNLIFSAPEGLPGPKAGVDGIDQQATMMLTPSASEAYITIRPPRQNGRVLLLDDPAARIGRAVDNDIRIIDWFIDPYQAVIEKNGSECRFRNMPDAPPAFLNGTNIDDLVLSEGDIIEIGTTQIVYTSSLQAAEMAREHRLPRRPVPVASTPEDLMPIIGSGFGDKAVATDVLPHDLDDVISEYDEEPAVSHDADTKDTGLEAAVVGAEYQEEPLNEIPAALVQGEEDIDEMDFAISLDALELDSKPVLDELPEDEDVFSEPLDNRNDPDVVDIPGQDISELDLGDLAEELAEPEEESPMEEGPLDTPLPVVEFLQSEASEPVLIEPESGFEGTDTEAAHHAQQVALWKRMLDNPSEAVRLQARKQLQKLTGKFEV